MIWGEELEALAYEPDHIVQVLAEIETNFPTYLRSFTQRDLRAIFAKELSNHEREQVKYEDYLDIETLEEFEEDPNAFKRLTRTQCPIIHRCLQSQDETMKAYKRSFNAAAGRQMLDPVRKLAEFGASYVAAFDDAAHEGATSPGDLGLEVLNDTAYGCGGVIGYGVQSSMLYGLYPREFAHRSQLAIWSLYFLSARKSFGLKDDSEFLMVDPKEGTCEQNFFYPAQLFGFYALKVYLLLRDALRSQGLFLDPANRYIYLSAFCDHIGAEHSDDIRMFKWSSEHVENQPWF